MSNSVGQAGSKTAFQAVVFDVYGTLLAIGDPFLRRRVPALLGISPRKWISSVRQKLLTIDYGDLETFIDFICSELAGGRGDSSQRIECAAVIEQELARVRPFEGALPLLRFLRRRGLKLGLVSNLSTAHVLPLKRLGLLDLVDAAVLSCEVGRAKPDPEIYLQACRRLEAQPEDVLMVGDSLRNDVRAPSALGLATLHVGSDGAASSVGRVADLGWMALTGPDPLRPLLEVGDEISLSDGTVVVRRIDPVPDSTQGRYNLVWRLEVSSASSPARPSVSRICFAKRYRFPESAYVEEFARRVMRMAGYDAPRAAVVDDVEPFLISESALGTPYAGELDPSIATELARHMVFAYIFANADIRPRNAHIHRGEGCAAITMIDLEYCFLDRALDVTGLPDPGDPRAIDAVGVEVLQQLTRKQVLSDRALRRARGEFFDSRVVSESILNAYRHGWVDAFRKLQSCAENLCHVIEERVYSAPPLIVGTRRYRRAMAGIDVADIRARLREDPAKVLVRVLA